MKGKNFDKEYFAGYYQHNVGNFSEKDLNRAKNWFYGWFWYLQKFVNFKKGNGRKVLEIGCSIGGASHILSDRGFTVYSSDISSFAVQRAEKLAKKLKKNISFYTFDVEKEIPIKEKFDTIIAFEVIEHLRSPLKAIRNMKNKLITGGNLICSTPNLPYDMSSDPTHINVKSEEEWIKIFKSAGFKNVTTSQVSIVPFFYKFSKYFHLILPIRLRSKLINSPLFLIAKN